MSNPVRTMALICLVAIAIPAPAADRPTKRGEARLAKLLADRVPGKSTSCLNERDIQSSQIVGGTAIVYRSFGKLYVNRPRGASSLDEDDILATRSFTGQLCRLDTVGLIDRASRTEHGFVVLEDFVPYANPRRKK